MLVLELPTPGNAVGFGQLDITGDRRLGVCDKADQVAVTDVGLDDDVTLGILAVDLHRAANPLKLGDARLDAEAAEEDREQNQG